MNAKNGPGPEEEEDVGAVDPRRGPIPTESPEDETKIDSRDIESDQTASPPLISK
ncbi:MAG: hypothetical protein JO025_12905 [Verrucomicrobia bacterium]|nr:hypothetical protein [Verrucomicrobiota bacterium]